MPSTVLIASTEHLPALKDREDLQNAVTFTDQEALRALQAIMRRRPDVVALEAMFASTSRGTALINRIKADPALTGCEIRIVSHDAGAPRPAPNRPPSPSMGGIAGSAAVAEVSRPPVAPLDQTGTRRAPRFKMVEGIEVQIDGGPAALVDLSVIGAQVVSPTILKPNQRIRVILPNGSPPLRLSAAVAWASFEIPRGTARYRAGIEFFDADAATVGRFIDKNKK